MKPTSPQIVRFLGLMALSATVLPLTARADDCDYVGRHNRADISPLSIAVTDVAASGEFVQAHQSIKIHVLSAGEHPVTYDMQPGDLFHALGIYVNVTGVETRGWLRAPFNPGAQDDILVDVPPNTIADCSDVTLTVDSRRTGHQYGCNVFGDDTKTFPGILVQGRRHWCTVIHGPIIHGPITHGPITHGQIIDEAREADLSDDQGSRGDPADQGTDATPSDDAR